MKFKEKGWVLSVDPASNLCGVSLWRDGELKAWAVLKSNSSKDPFSVRLQTIAVALDRFLFEHVPGEDRITQVVCEGVRSTPVQICLGAILVCKYIQCSLTGKDLVHTSSWKSWAKNRGAVAESLGLIKGLKALKEIGWDFGKYNIDSDDVADSVLIYMTWRDRK